MDEFKYDNIIKGINLKNYMIKFEPLSKSLLLYNLKGILLDKKYIDFLINDICIIDDNYILIRIFYNILIKIKIFNNTIEISDKLFIKKLKIYDFIYIKESKLLIISFETIIGIWDINSLLKNPIQIIKNYSHNLFNFNLNKFISYDNIKVSIYQKTNNIKLYQLSTILTLDNNYSVNNLRMERLDIRTLMIAQKNEIYLIDIRNMTTKKKYKFINGKVEINSLYIKEKNIYLNIGNYLYTIRYNKSNLEIIAIIKEHQLKEYYIPLSSAIKAKLENENILNNNESIKFFSFKQENSIKFIKEEIRLQNNNNNNDEFSLINTKLQLYGCLDFLKYYIYQLKCDKDKVKSNIFDRRALIQNERRNEVRKSKKYPIKIFKSNYDKRSKFKKMNKIKIRNNPNKLKKKYR